MRISTRRSAVGIPLTLTLSLPLALALPAAAARGPLPVSPGAQTAGAAVEARCPTFLWAGAPAASGYELAVFRVSGDGTEPTEPRLVTRASVPGDARGWTPPAGNCLERGARYAWSVAAAGAELAWSTPFLFEVEAAPSLEELEQAIATIELYRMHGGTAHAMADRPAPPDRAQAREMLTEDAQAGHVRSLRPRASSAPDAALDAAFPGALVAPTTGVTRLASAGVTPTLGTPSLRVSANIALGAASNLFKANSVFLWDDTDGNTALGRNALTSAQVSGSGYSPRHNTAVGRQALQNTTGGIFYFNGSYNVAIGAAALRYNTTGSYNTASGSSALRYNTTGSTNTASGSSALRYNTTGFNNTANGLRALRANTTGSSNTASGFYALRSNTTGTFNTASGSSALLDNTTGYRNTASGYAALRANTTGSYNAASGSSALRYNTTGTRNTAVGPSAGFNATTGNDNIFLGSGASGAAGDGNTIRIGGATGTGQGQQNRTFIAGIRGITALPADAIGVLISSTGQLGTVSSSRSVKQDIQDLGPLAERLLALRPVAFRYRQHAALDPDTPLQFGLIAEEVAEVFPDLVVFDQDGKPETVKYHLLSSLLLGELQRQHEDARQQHRVVLELGAEIQRLASRLEAIEAQNSPSARRDRDRRPRGR